MKRRLPIPCSFVAVTGTLIALLIAAGCRSDNSTPRPPGTIESSLPAVAPTVIAASLGRPLVIPLELTGPLDGSGTIPARFGDRPVQSATLWWVAVETETAPARPELATSLSFRSSVWLETSRQGRPQRWSATPAAAGTRPASDGGWIAVLDPPTDPEPAPGTTLPLEISGRHYLVRWHERSDADSRAFRFFHTPVISDQERRSDWFRAALDQCSHSPQLRWRARLALGPEPARIVRTDDQGPAARPAPLLPPSDLFSDPVLEASALQIESAWHAALDRLASDDAELAQHVAARLCAAADFGGGVLMPAWPSEAETATLLRALTDDVPASQLRTRAADWLQAHSTPVAWITDDSGATDLLTKRPITTISAANLSSKPVAAVIPRDPGAGSPDIISIPALSARAIPAPLSPPSAGPTPRPGRHDLAPLAAVSIAREGQPVVIRLGDARFTRNVLAAALPVIPPGAPIGPLLPDLSLREWLDLGPDAPPSRPLDPARAPLLGNGWLGAGLLYRRQVHPAEAGAPAVSEWTIYIELSTPEPRQPSGEAAEGSGFVTVWLGPFNAPTDIFRVNADGSVLEQAGASPQPAPAIRIAREGDHWSCWLPVPASAIEPDGTIRLALERVDSRGVRSAWPRAMLPWQREPGRAVFSTRAWGDAAGSN
jgi:hypothetical protein